MVSISYVIIIDIFLTESTKFNEFNCGEAGLVFCVVEFLTYLLFMTRNHRRPVVLSISGYYRVMETELDVNNT